ncbi:prolyl oligopeptidase family serine peptidase [Alishewanella longhuensis]
MRTLFTAALLLSAGAYATADDPYLWLEEVSSDNAMAWVTEQNNHAEKALTAYPKYQQFYNGTLEVMDSSDKIDYPSRVGNYLYNFWRDANHTKGLYRRTTATSYASGKPEWQTVLDIDALAEAEGENWVFKGMSCLYPAYQQCLVYLSRGGADATVVREFSKTTMSFVENGFFLPEAKSQVTWRDENSLFVATDFGEGSLTDSGYPRITKIWQRGANLAEAATVYEGDKTSVAASTFRMFTADKHYDLVYESLTFYSNQAWLLADGKKIAIPKPESATLGGIFADALLLNLRQDWPEHGFKQGSVVSMPIAAIKAGKPEVSLVMAPSANLSIERIARTKDYLLVSVLEDVKTKVLRLEQREGKWHSTEIPLAENASIGIFNTDEADNTFHYTVTGFLTPASLYTADSKTLEKQLLRQAPSWFDESKFKVEQHKAKSKDGTLVPYFVVMPKALTYNGKNPTLLYGYGGFEVSLTPAYSAAVGRNWLAEGGVYVLANIRGGGEYGPAWHQAALQKNRMKAYEDFFAIAEDLIARKITSPQHLGIKGGSNGGLLTGAAMVLRPELFGAVISQVPLLDMRRYHQLLAGASWMAEYGDPDQDEFWQVIKTYSPYHNVHKDKKYPKAFFYTSTRDDRVHPAHARKMVARLLEQGHPVYYYENIEGGHAGASDNRQSARMAALEYSYLWQQLK